MSIVKLISKDGKTFEVPVNVAKLSVLIKDTIEGDTNDDDDEEDKAMFEMPLPNVTSETLQKVIDYCTYYVESTPMDPITTPLRSADLKDLVQTWYTEYVDVSRDLLFDLVAAANFMDIKPLLDLTCLAVSILIKGKSAPELREMFNITSELTEEDLAQDQQAETWAQEEAAEAAAEAAGN